MNFEHDSLETVLERAGHDRSLLTCWIWEGVVPYLTKAQVTATVAALAARSAPGSRLIVNFQVSGIRVRLGQLVGRALMASTGRSSVWADEPWRSTWTPAAMAALLGRHGYAVTRDHDLLDTATALALPIRHATSLRHGRVMVADRS